MQVSWKSMLAQLVAAILVLLVTCSSACFIRNCPPGGKRALEDMSPEIHGQRQCMACGPSGLGQCLGPNICCGPSIGCFMNSAETEACQKENDDPTPCEVEGAACGGDGQGRCVADGVCCTDQKCSLDYHCEAGPNTLIASKRSRNMSPELLKFIRRLVDHKSYQRRK